MIYLVADTSIAPPEKLILLVEQALRGGVGLVQLRAKENTPSQREELSIKLADLCDAYGVGPLVVNDDLALAARHHFDLHIGQSDVPYALARATLGPNATIGLSLESESQFNQALALPGERAMVSLSPVFATQTKLDAAPAMGIAALQRLVMLSPVPVLAIGGINSDTIAQIARTGAYGACVISAILNADNPEQATKALTKAWEEGLSQEFLDYGN
jgi:thiamine-phosphate pyrophosphorylase